MEGHFLQTTTFRYVSENGRVASAEIIKQDMEELQHQTERIEAFVDRELAHLDRRGVLTAATFNDLDEALDALDRIACKYICLLTGGHRDTLAGTIQDLWTDIFTVPLRRPG